VEPVRHVRHCFVEPFLLMGRVGADDIAADDVLEQLVAGLGER
jgi:hypothetical protein